MDKSKNSRVVSKLSCFTTRRFSHVPVAADRHNVAFSIYDDVSPLLRRRRPSRLRKARLTRPRNSHARVLCHAFACIVQIYKKRTRALAKKKRHKHIHSSIHILVECWCDTARTTRIITYIRRNTRIFVLRAARERIDTLAIFYTKRETSRGQRCNSSVAFRFSISSFSRELKLDQVSRF